MLLDGKDVEAFSDALALLIGTETEKFIASAEPVTTLTTLFCE